MKSFFQFNILREIVHGITRNNDATIPYGNFNLAEHTGDELQHVWANREAFANKLSIKLNQLIFADQTHSSNVSEVISLDKNPIPDTDALITNKKNICLNILTADCVPLLLYDPIKRVTGVVHAGWRGTASSIVVKTINQMCVKYNTSPSDILVGIGPCISQGNYEIGKEVADQFSNDCLLKQANGKLKLDLVKANRNQLLVAGVKPENIEQSGICTFESKEYYSARREGIQSGRFSSFVML